MVTSFCLGLSPSYVHLLVWLLVWLLVRLIGARDRPGIFFVFLNTLKFGEARGFSVLCLWHKAICYPFLRASISLDKRARFPRPGCRGRPGANLGPHGHYNLTVRVLIGYVMNSASNGCNTRALGTPWNAGYHTLHFTGATPVHSVLQNEHTNCDNFVIYYIYTVIIHLSCGRTYSIFISCLHIYSAVELCAVFWSEQWVIVYLGRMAIVVTTLAIVVTTCSIVVTTLTIVVTTYSVFCLCSFFYLPKISTVAPSRCTPSLSQPHQIPTSVST